MKSGQQDVNQWRVEIARRVAPVYTALPVVRAVVLTGGVARGLGDAYSDIDLAVFWDRAPTEVERRIAQGKIGRALGAKVINGDLQAHQVLGPTDHGMLWEEAAYVAGGADTGFKIDINHRTVEAMTRILADVVLQHDTHPHKQEVLYAIRRVVVLYGAELVQRWQAQAAIYPEALARKIVTAHLDALRVDVAMHITRGDWLPYYQTLTAAESHLLGVLLALNRIYRPELKRLQHLCDEMTIKPPALAERLHGILRAEPAQAVTALDKLVLEVFELVSLHLPQVSIKAARQRYFQRRQPFSLPPLDL